jgi:hypothetical protein
LNKAVPPNLLPLDRFIAQPDVRERFEMRVKAPAWLVMRVAREFDMQSPWLVRLIFNLRGRLMRARPAPPRESRGLVAELTALGWGVLVDDGDRLLVCGAATRPWEADVRFAAVASDGFADYSEPHLVKIAWTLETYPAGANATRLAHETRVVATDSEARRLFLRYWRWARFGIIAIRWLLLPAIRREAERQWRTNQTTTKARPI